jgi:uncharacterized membrane protein YoaK (UPF0700 family)
MNDQYSITDKTEDRRGLLRPLLWLGLIVSAVANAVVSSAIGNAVVASAFGAVALAFATALVVHHYRHRAH